MYVYIYIYTYTSVYIYIYIYIYIYRERERERERIRSKIKSSKRKNVMQCPRTTNSLEAFDKQLGLKFPAKETNNENVCVLTFGICSL